MPRMTRDEFEELIIEYGNEKADQATAYEWGSRHTDKYITEAREKVLAEHDRLTAGTKTLIQVVKEVDTHINPKHLQEKWYQEWADRANTAIRDIEETNHATQN